MVNPALSDVETRSISNVSFFGISLVSFVSAKAFSACIFSALFTRLHCRHTHTRLSDAPRYEIWVSLCWNVFQLLLFLLLLFLLLLAKQDAQAAAGLGQGKQRVVPQLRTRCFFCCLALASPGTDAFVSRLPQLGLVCYSSVWVSV